MRSKFLARRRDFHSNSGSGQALVELAMILAFSSLLVLLCLGIVQFGKVIFWSIEVSNAAKAGAQYGAQQGGNAVDGTGIQNAAAAAAPDLSLTTSSSLMCVCTTTGAYSNYSSTSGCSGVTCSGSVNLGVSVSTSATVSPPYRLRPFPASYTLTGSATQECAQ